MNNVLSIISNMPIKMRPDNRYEGRLTINGTRKSFYGGTKSEVKQKARDYLLKVENGYREPKKITLNEYIHYWLVTYKLNKIEPSSYTRLYRVYECQLRDTIGKKMIGNITTADIQKLIDEHANPVDSDVKPLALSGLKRIIHLLHPCLEMAVEENIISKNPCEKVVLPTESCMKTQTKEQITLTDDEISDFKEAALSKYKTTGEYKSRDAIILLLMMNLGLRVGEMLALEWKDVKLDEKIIFINKTLQSNLKNFSNTGNAQYSRIKNSTKTQAGMRVLPLGDKTLEYFEILQSYDERHNIKSKYVCATGVGTQNNPRNLQRSLNRVLRQAQISKNVTLHTLRHTFGSTMLRHGVSIEVISKLMGHSNINITYTKYIHVIQEQKAKAMQMVNIC
ncbi:MAG: site-specific integrase [Acetatifactor sp.]|nr:site-specific integrase [Acetatifactor sp.]